MWIKCGIVSFPPVTSQTSTDVQFQTLPGTKLPFSSLDGSTLDSSQLQISLIPIGWLHSRTLSSTRQPFFPFLDDSTSDFIKHQATLSITHRLLMKAPTMSTQVKDLTPPPKLAQGRSFDINLSINPHFYADTIWDRTLALPRRL